MKKLFFITVLSMSLLACSNDDTPDCECDKVVSTNYNYFGMPGGGGFWSGSFNTVNECTGETRTWNIQNYGRPEIGECK